METRNKQFKSVDLNLGRRSNAHFHIPMGEKHNLLNSTAKDFCLGIVDSFANVNDVARLIKSFALP